MGTRERGITLGEVRRVFERGARPGTPLTASEVAEEVGCVRRTAHSKLQALVDADDLRTKKVGARARVWWRPVGDASTADGAEGLQFRSFVEAVEEYAIFRLDPGGFVRSWNVGAERIKGYERDAILGEHVSTFYTETDREAVVPERNLAAAARDGTVEDEGWRVRANGTRFWATVTITAIRDEDGDLQGFAKVTRDMTDRRERERQLRSERDLVERIFETSPVGLGVLTRDGLERVNARGARIYGAPDDDLDDYGIGEPEVYDADGRPVPADERPNVTAFETGETVDDWECQFDGADGRRRWLSVSAAPLGDGGGDVDRVVVAVEDVTGLKERARWLQRQRDDLESELAEVFERVDDGFVALDTEGRFTYVNERAAALLESSSDELLGEHVWDALGLEPRAAENYAEAMETGEPVSIVEYYEPLDRWFEAHIYPSDTGLSVYFQNVTERKEREHELERYRTIVETIDDSVYTVDDDGRFTMVNSAYVEMVGRSREDLLGAHVSTVVDEETVERAHEFERRLVDGELDSAKLTAELTVGGETHVGEATFAMLPSETDGHERVGVVRDVTERRERERELERYVRLVDAVGNPVYELDERGRITFVNDAFVERSGYEESELIGAHVSIGMDEEAVARAEALLADLVADGANGNAALEYEVVTQDGERIPVENHLAPLLDEDGRLRGSAGVMRDVTELRERERDLEESRRRYKTLVENFPNGAVALVDADLRYVTVGGTPLEATGTTRAELEGNPLDEVLPPVLAEKLVPRYRDALDGVESAFEQAVGGETYQFRILPVRDSTGDVFAALGMSQDVTERVERERELARQRERLAALDDLNGVVRDITDAVIDQSTREEIERVVCENLASADSYEFAWIGEVDEGSRTVVVREQAGVEGYLDGITISVDPDDERSRGPTGRAVLDGAVVVAQNLLEDSSHEPWREHAESYGFRSSTAIPIRHEGTLYGVLNVYTDRPHAFDEAERAVVGQLGEVVGHAIAAIDRKRALMSDEVTALRFRVRDVFAELDLPNATDGRITFDEGVPVGNGVFLEYGTVTEDAIDALRAAVDRLPHWESVSIREPEAGVAKFELRLDNPPVVSAVAANGGSIEEMVVEDGDVRMTVHLSPTVEARRIIDVVAEAYPAAEMVARRQTTRPSDAADTGRTMTSDLTDRQRAALDAAYYSGFFEWPRETTGEAVAESLGVSSPTFYQHLRKAENKLLTALYSAPEAATT